MLYRYKRREHNQIERYRKLLGVSQKEFLENVTLAQSALSHIESKYPKAQSISQIRADQIIARIVELSIKKSNGKQILYIGYDDVFPPIGVVQNA